MAIKHIIAVSSAKGGVGKSTSALNTALALAEIGHITGLLDADIYGPSIPKMLNLMHEKPEAEDKKLIPLEKHGLKLMSMGFMADPDKAVMWRGPMVSSALQQMIFQTEWGDLDVLVIDMPPGTGDIHLTLVQKVPEAKAILVSTPQDIALQDTRRGVAMFKRLNIKILGLVENMSYFMCDSCDKKHYLFPEDGGHKEAERLGVRFLGSLPIDKDLRESCDVGEPVMVSNYAPHIRDEFRSIAQKVSAQL